MKSWKPRPAGWLIPLLSAVLLAGCLTDFEPRGAGEYCRRDPECIEGLICVNLTCIRPEDPVGGGGATDAGPDASPDASPADGGGEDAATGDAAPDSGDADGGADAASEAGGDDAGEDPDAAPDADDDDAS